MADEMAVRGLVTEIGIKDGTSAKGDWRKYSFNIQSHEDGQKNWYSWFNTKGAEIKTGISYYLTYSTSENKQNTDHPYRNVQTMSEIDTPANAAAGTSTVDDREDKFRTKEELRFTEAMHLAARMAQITPTPSVPLDNYFEQQKDSVTQWARWFYEMLCNAPGNDKSTARPPAPRKASDPKESSDVAKNGASAETIGTDQAAKLMQMAEDLGFGRKKVIDTITAQWKLTQPHDLTTEQMDTVIALMNAPEQGQRAHDEDQAEEGAAAHDAKVAGLFEKDEADKETAGAVDDLPF